jgi:hypothetical protein
MNKSLSEQFSGDPVVLEGCQSSGDPADIVHYLTSM